MNTYLKNFMKFSRFNYSNGAARIKRGEIVNYEYRVKEMPDFSKVSPGSKLKLKLRLARVPTKIREVPPPQHDYLNFNKMTGNEILLNMKNCEHFTKIEIISSLLQLRKRINLEVNSEYAKYPWHKHNYVSKTIQKLVQHLGGLNLRHTLNASIIFNSFSIMNEIVWRKLEANVNKSLHKIKTKELFFFLDLFERINKGTPELFVKMITILPVHVEFLSLKEFTRIFEVCINKNLGTDKLYHIYFLKKLERNAHRMNFDMYIKNLTSLGRRRFDLDSVFYYNYMLPPIFSFEYTLEKASILNQTLHFLRENCIAIDFKKYIEIIENLIKQFTTKKQEGHDISKLKLKLKKDLSIVPKDEEEGQNVDTEVLEQQLKDSIKNDLGLDNLDGVIEKDDINEELILMKELNKQKKSKKEEKKEILKKRLEKRLSKEKEKEKTKETETEPEHEKEKEKENEKEKVKVKETGKEKEKTKESEKVELEDEEKEDNSKVEKSQKGPRRRQARGLPNNAPDLATDVHPPKDKHFKANDIVKKNKRLKDEFEEPDSRNRE